MKPVYFYAATEGSVVDITGDAGASSGAHTGAIVGGVVGGLLGLAIVCILAATVVTVVIMKSR